LSSVRSRLVAPIALIALMTLVGGSTAGTPVERAAQAAAKPITVFAGASLTDVFPAIDPNETYSFAGSPTLATQIMNGAPADVFASANTTIPAALYAQGFIEKPVNFTRNKLVIVVPKANPAGVSDIYDLTKPGVKIDIGNPAVPIGSYTLAILKNMNLTSKILANVVSQENDVRTVLTKVVVGQADAGFVFSTDALTVSGQVKVIKVPAWAQPTVTYAMAVVTRSPNKAAAQSFMRLVLSKAGQSKLHAFGFLPLPSPTSAAGVLAG
jgi:molybdate transport system substrate-binding protein